MKKEIQRVLIVAEKPRAAEQIAYALAGDKKNVKIITKKPVPILEFRANSKIYRITSVKGHLFTSEFSKAIHEKRWREVDPKYLLTKAPLVKVIRPESREVVKVLKKECKRADVLIIATDFDREGENIGMQVADLIAKKVNHRIIVKRARFSSLTKEEIKKAFKEENLVDLDKNKIDASETRQELDLRYGVAFTRLATLKLHEKFKTARLPLLSIGPCQTPTLALVVRRYLEHLKSKERARGFRKFRVKVICKVNSGEVKFLSEKVFLSKEEAINFAKGLGREIIIEDIKENEKKISRPLPLNTNRLASLAAKYLGFESYKTLKLAEKLYLEGLISYPRTETEIFKRETLKAAWRILEEMRRNRFIPGDYELQNPCQGKRDDHAHPPIHPKKWISFSKIKRKLGVNAAKLYELICRHFVANFSSDAILKEFVIKARDNEGNKYVAKTTIIEKEGFLRIYRYERVKSIREKKALIGRIKIASKLPILRYEIIEEKPRIIPPITESELIKLMDKLGIGTDATFAEHIRKIIERGYVTRHGNKLIPTPYGIAIIKALEELVPEIVNPKIRAKIEAYFKAVEEGKMTRKEAVRDAIQKFTVIYNSFKTSIGSFIDRVVSGMKTMGLDFFRKLKRRKSR